MTSTAPGRGSPKALAGPPRPRKPLQNTRAGNIAYLGVLVAGLFLIPFWPIFIALQARDAYYVNHYFETLWHCLRTFGNTIRNKSWVRIFKYNLWKTPIAVEEQLGSRLGACTRCAKCCKMLKCDYLAYDKKTHEYFCSVYDTKYWHFGACGRYPIDQDDIDDYNCPGFAFPESVEKARMAAAGLIQIGKLKG